ncbi:MAG: acylphosphatase [Bacteroidia bacterium]|nr:acylphosphatase [Bacteroidia bacterium]
MHLCYTIRVFGKVQGVFYRKSTRNQAIHHNILGTVRNLDDGSVEIRAVGTKEDLDSFLSWCKIGPSGAIVERLDYKAVNAIPDFSSFEISY